jgi:hypothetical protein
MPRAARCGDRSIQRPQGQSQVDNSGCVGTDLINVLTTERLLENPEARRSWLLLKALEELPLDQALEIAQVAERFLSGDRSESRSNTGIFARPPAAKAVGLPATDETPAGVSNGTGIEDHGRRSADLLDLVVLAPIDDITRYLEQHGDLSTSKGNLFVVNGQSEVTLDELLARANSMRVRQGLPTYTLLPAALVVAAKKAEQRPPKPPRPPCRKEREHWARQVMKS